MSEKCLLKALGEVDNQYIEEAEPMKTTQGRSNRRKWASIAACFVFVTVIGIAFLQGLFGTRVEIATLENGETITFARGNNLATSIDLDVTIRALDENEVKMLFGDLPITANGYFDTDYHNMIGLEGRIGNVKLVVSSVKQNLLCTVIEGRESISTVEGVSVTAGYFATDENSRGEKTVIYYATIDLGENYVYVEYSGMERDRENVKNELVDRIQQLIENGNLDLSKIQE